MSEAAKLAAVPSEKKERSSIEIQAEYQNLCLKAGQVQYQKAVSESDLQRLNSALRDLSIEYAKAQQREKLALAKKQEEEAKVVVPEGTTGSDSEKKEG